jgi:hypothetical protein
MGPAWRWEAPRAGFRQEKSWGRFGEFNNPWQYAPHLLRACQKSIIDRPGRRARGCPIFLSRRSGDPGSLGHRARGLAERFSSGQNPLKTVSPALQSLALNSDEKGSQEGPWDSELVLGEKAAPESWTSAANRAWVGSRSLNPFSVVQIEWHLWCEGVRNRAGFVAGSERKWSITSERTAYRWAVYDGGFR